MPEVSALGSVRANGNAATGGSGTITSGSEETRWFTGPARELLGADAGFNLHVATGAPESSCYRWMRGDAPIPIYRYRKLLHGPAGATWLNVIMHGCEQPWWREFQAARDLCLKFKIEARNK